mmetsp:Transcript_7140/g.15585  ORF Transcript_7140/g.15585 Transcript_7140/m.15585 type:complete len:139 (-) Transcript_7140:526-942(-)
MTFGQNAVISQQPEPEASFQAVMVPPSSVPFSEYGGGILGIGSDCQPHALLEELENLFFGLGVGEIEPMPAPNAAWVPKENAFGGEPNSLHWSGARPVVAKRNTNSSGNETVFSLRLMRRRTLASLGIVAVTVSAVSR